MISSDRGPIVMISCKQCSSVCMPQWSIHPPVQSLVTSLSARTRGEQGGCSESILYMQDLWDIVDSRECYGEGYGTFKGLLS